MLLFGFSMPTSDELFVQLMRNACERKRRLRRVGAIDIVADQVLERFNGAVNPTCQIEYVPLPVVPDQIPAWFVPSSRPVFEF